MPKTKTNKGEPHIKVEAEKKPEFFERFSGAKRHFLGIKSNDEGVVPCHGYSIAVIFPSIPKRRSRRMDRTFQGVRRRR